MLSVGNIFVGINLIYLIYIYSKRKQNSHKDISSKIKNNVLIRYVYIIDTLLVRKVNVK